MAFLQQRNFWVWLARYGNNPRSLTLFFRLPKWIEWLRIMEMNEGGGKAEEEKNGVNW